MNAKHKIGKELSGLFPVSFWGMAIVLSFCLSVSGAENGSPSRIGPTRIRFYSGNLHVGMFMDYWGMDNTFSGSSGDIVDEALIQTLQRTSCESMCDYITWCCVQNKKEKWDWQPYLAGARKLEDAKLGYNTFCWLHFPPKWYLASQEFVGYVNLETGRNIPQLSLWSPHLSGVFDRFYEQLSEKLGAYIDFVRVAMPSEYGEVGYCDGMTKWLVPQEDAGPGFWCGDRYAKADFRKAMLKRHGSLERLNCHWGTDFSSIEDVAMPAPNEMVDQLPTSLHARRCWVDFLDWYQQSWVVCMSQVTAAVRKHFPNEELIASLGYGVEFPRLGNDQSRHIQAMSNLHLSCQSPGDIGFFATRRVSSACRHFNVAYYTEPPGDVPADRQLNRIFMDISNGTQTWFDYPQNLNRGIEHFRKYKKFLTGASPRTSVALWHPTLDHWLHPEQPWSEKSIELADPLREIMAYEIVDDRMIETGALESLGIQQLVLAGGDWLDREAWTTVHRWVAGGGIFIVLQRRPLRDIEGNTDLWDTQAPRGVPKFDLFKQSDECFDLATKKMGQGLIVTLDCEGANINEVAEVLGHVCTHCGSHFQRPQSNAKRIDNTINGLWATRFDDQILYFNYTDSDQAFKLEYRKEDFSPLSKVPEVWQVETVIPARTIYAVRLIDP